MLNKHSRILAVFVTPPPWACPGWVFVVGVKVNLVFCIQKGYTLSVAGSFGNGIRKSPSKNNPPLTGECVNILNKHSRSLSGFSNSPTLGLPRVGFV